MSTLEPCTRFLLIRHANHDSGGRFLQHACTGLSPVGMTQARALATRLAGEPSLTSPVVMASRARRAIETAEILAGALGVPVAEPTCDLCEVHPGAAEGLTPEEMDRRYGPVSGWTRPYQAVPGADDFADWLARSCVALTRIATMYHGRQILAVTHAGVIRASFVAFGRRPEGEASRITSANTAITEWTKVAAVDAGSAGRWRLARHGDVEHLLTSRVPGT